MDIPGFIAGSYQSQSPLADCEQTVNLYPEQQESPGATKRWALYPTPGFQSLGSLVGSAGPGRAHFWSGSREFAVIGTSFCEIDQTGVVTNRGTVAIGDNPATISSNGDGGGQLLITSGGNGYLFTLGTNAFAAIAALAGKADQGAQIDGYFLALDFDTSTVYFSNLLDGATWDTGTDFWQRSAQPDSWRSMIVCNRLIYLLGSQTSEIWYNAGTFPVPFTLHPSGLIQYGCVASFSPDEANGTVCWLASSEVGQGMVIRCQGFNPEVVSTFALQNKINGFGRIDDAFGDCYDDLGHTFYVLSFPQANATVCYDFQSNLWHDRGSWDSMNNRYNAWRPRFHALCFGQHRMLDAGSSGVFRMSSTLYTDVDGTGIRRLRRCAVLEQENQRLYYGTFELDVQPGLGTETGQGADPQVMMRYSNDAGQNWSPELWRSAGKLGEYSHRVRWLRMGSGRRRVFEVVMTDPIAWRILGAYLDIPQQPRKLSQAAAFQWSQ